MLVAAQKSTPWVPKVVPGSFPRGPRSPRDPRGVPRQPDGDPRDTPNRAKQASRLTESSILKNGEKRTEKEKKRKKLTNLEKRCSRLHESTI